MALVSAVTGEIVQEQPVFHVPVTLAFPNPYTPGGEALDPTDHVPPDAEIINTMGDCNDLYTFRFDRTNEKVLVFVNATGAEAGAIDLSLQTGIVITFVCK